MNEVALNDKNLSVDRTPQLIAIEINSIKEQTRKILLFNSIEIGKRLAEAKIMLGHGEWGNWLKESVDYSQRTASNLIGIFEQYGTSQINMFCDNNAKSQALANLSYTQAVLLMGIPMDEREAFIEDHDVESMTTRELQQAIKEKQELEVKLMELEVAWGKDKNITINAKKIAEEENEKALKLLEEKQLLESDLRTTDKCLRDAQADVKMLEETLEKERENSKKEKERLVLSISETKRLLAEAQSSGNNDEVERLEKDLEETQSELAASISKVADLEQRLNEPIEVTAAEVIEKIPEEIERELAELRERNKELEAKGAQSISTATIRFKLQWDSLVKGFGDLLRVLDEIEDREKYKNAVSELIGKMSERL